MYKYILWSGIEFLFEATVTHWNVLKNEIIIVFLENCKLQIMEIWFLSKSLL